MSGEERRGPRPTTVRPRCGVGCPALISARFGSGFPSNPDLPKPQREVGGRREKPLYFFFFKSGQNIKVKKKKLDHTSHFFVVAEQLSFLPLFFPPIRKDKQRMIHRFHTGVRF